MSGVRTALYERLAGDQALTGLLSAPDAIYHQVAPQDTETPFVVFHKQTGTPRWQFGGGRVESELWAVRAVDMSASATRAEDIAARLDELLNDAELTIDGATLLAIFRESDIDYPETVGADTYHHVGGVYRVVTQPA